eukprot:1473243-Pleurochrysis_carterae.AAC.1
MRRKRCQWKRQMLVPLRLVRRRQGRNVSWDRRPRPAPVEKEKRKWARWAKEHRPCWCREYRG